MLSHGLAVEVEFVGDRRQTPPLLLQIAYVHKILQVEHWAPWSAQRFHTWGFFDRRYWGSFAPQVKLLIQQHPMPSTETLTTRPEAPSRRPATRTLVALARPFIPRN